MFHWAKEIEIYFIFFQLMAKLYLCCQEVASWYIKESGVKNKMKNHKGDKRTTKDEGKLIVTIQQRHQTKEGWNTEGKQERVKPIIRGSTEREHDWLTRDPRLKTDKMHTHKNLYICIKIKGWLFTICWLTLCVFKPNVYTLPAVLHVIFTAAFIFTSGHQKDNFIVTCNITTGLYKTSVTSPKHTNTHQFKLLEMNTKPK